MLERHPRAAFAHHEAPERGERLRAKGVDGGNGETLGSADALIPAPMLGRTYLALPGISSWVATAAGEAPQGADLPASRAALLRAECGIAYIL